MLIEASELLLLSKHSCAVSNKLYFTKTLVLLLYNFILAIGVLVRRNLSLFILVQKTEVLDTFTSDNKLISIIFYTHTSISCCAYSYGFCLVVQVNSQVLGTVFSDRHGMTCCLFCVYSKAGL